MSDLKLLKPSMRVNERACKCGALTAFVWRAGEPELDESHCGNCGEEYPKPEPSPFVVTGIDHETRTVTIGVKE